MTQAAASRSDVVVVLKNAECRAWHCCDWQLSCDHTVFDGDARRNVLVMCFSQDLVDALLRDMIVCVVCARVRVLCYIVTIIRGSLCCK